MDKPTHEQTREPSELALLYEMFLGAVEVEDWDGAKQVKKIIVEQHPRLNESLEAMIKEKAPD